MTATASPLPDAMRKALGRVLAQMQADWKKDLGRIEAESRAVIAEHRLAIGSGQLEGLTRRLDEIEKRGIRFRGTHQRAETYAKGDMVVSDGSLWACVSDASGDMKPGASQNSQLAAKGMQR